MTDFTHFFINHVVVQVGVFIAAIPLYLLFGWAIAPEVKAAIASQREWLQFLEALLVAEISFYAIHRLAHTVPWLWRFHAIHHSSPELDWLASARFHPVEMILAKLAVGTPLVLLGFTKETFGGYLFVSAFQSLFVHANVKFQFPVLRWIVSTPEFHHWHHSNEPKAQNKNFGQPWVDLLFGTFYLPRGEMPTTYGANDPIPASYLRQMLYPFQ